MKYGKTELSEDTINWLLESNPWTKYGTLTKLLDRPINEDEVKEVKRELLTDSLVVNLKKDAAQWFPYLPKRHDDSKLSHYKLRMLADLGLNTDELKEIVEKLKTHKKDGLFQIRQELPIKDAQKESEDNQIWNALPCDSPLLTYILLKLNTNDTDAKESLEYFKKSWETTEGWFCNLSFVKGQFKKHKIGCPIYGLQCLEIFSLFPELHNSKEVLNAFEPLKYHKELGQNLYYFGRSKKFWTLKYPYIWYNALYIGDVLSRFKVFKDSELLKEIIDWIENSFDNDGKITPTSMFREYKDWDFSDKKSPSPWLTFICYIILKRFYS